MEQEAAFESWGVMDAPQAAIETARGLGREMEPITFTAITGRKKKSRMLLVTELINAGLEMDKKGCPGLSASRSLSRLMIFSDSPGDSVAHSN